MTDIREVGWDEVERRHCDSPPDVSAGCPADDLTIAVQEPPSVDGTGIVFRGVLTNTTDSALRIVASDLGANALGFWVGFDKDAPVKYDGPPRPPAPPMPLEMKIPARTAVRFTRGLTLWQYAYEGRPTVRVNYGFSLHDLEGLSGHLELRLPPRPERPKPNPGGTSMPMPT